METAAARSTPARRILFPPCPRASLGLGSGRAEGPPAWRIWRLQARARRTTADPAVVDLWRRRRAARGIRRRGGDAASDGEEMRAPAPAAATESIRNRWLPSLPAQDLIPGDVVQLRVGDKVPADMRVTRLVTSTLRIKQGSLTGETASVNKTAQAVPLDDADIQAKECMVFVGTTVVNGSAVCLVAPTGMATEIGKIHTQIHEAAQEDDDTPLKKKLNEFDEALTKIIGLVCALVWLINVKQAFRDELDISRSPPPAPTAARSHPPRSSPAIYRSRSPPQRAWCDHGDLREA